MTGGNRIPEKQVTIVTGGSGSIGRAIVAALGRLGHEIINLSLEPIDEENVRNLIVDLTDADAIDRALSDICGTERITGLVNNAGFPYVTGIEDLDLDKVQGMIDIHCLSALRLMKGVTPSMRHAGYGRIVNIGSRMILGRSGRSVYSLVKSGMLGVTRSLSLELAKDGVTVNMVSPKPPCFGKTIRQEHRKPKLYCQPSRLVGSEFRRTSGTQWNSSCLQSPAS